MSRSQIPSSDSCHWYLDDCVSEEGIEKGKLIQSTYKRIFLTKVGQMVSNVDVYGNV